MILNIPGVIHLFVALLGPILGVLLGIPVSPKTFMENFDWRRQQASQPLPTVLAE